MSRRKQRLGLVGFLALIALGVVVFASSAQALTPKYLVGKKAVAAGLNAKLEGKQVGRISFLIPALGVELNCEKVAISEGLITSGTHGQGGLVGEECSVLELKSPLGEIPCTIKNSKKISATGLILPAELTNGQPAILLENYSALGGMEGAECPLPLDNLFKGEICMKILNNDTVKPQLVSNEAIQKECRERFNLGGAEEIGSGFKDKLLFGTQEAFLDATIEVFLGGAAHTGLTLGVSLQ